MALLGRHAQVVRLRFGWVWSFFLSSVGLVESTVISDVSSVVSSTVCSAVNSTVVSSATDFVDRRFELGPESCNFDLRSGFLSRLLWAPELQINFRSTVLF